RKISHDVKLAPIQRHQFNLLGLRDVLECCGFSECTWFRVLKRALEPTSSREAESTLLPGRAHAPAENTRFISFQFTTIFPRARVCWPELVQETQRNAMRISVQSSLHAAWLSMIQQC
ncbi:hypothetical protein M405DRAFT_922163, partial [Rhizopogon salebrosus TDB-379]